MKKGKATPEPAIIQLEGVPASAQWPDEDEVFQRACLEWERTRQLEEMRAAQFVAFNRGPVCIVFVGDQHFGDPGTDVVRAFNEADLIRRTPGTFAVLLGDLLNQYIIGTLRQARDNARLAIADEWALVRRYLTLIGPKLLAAVPGNHAFWAELLTGVDYFREVLAVIRPDCIYDADDVRLTVCVGGVKFPGRIRHRWRGYSIYNPTHGIERAAKWDQDFLWAAGGHTHAAGVAREFNVGGRLGLAVQVGSYKRVDEYARRLGLSLMAHSTAVAVIFDDATASMVGISNLDLAARVMRTIWPD